MWLILPDTMTAAVGLRNVNHLLRLTAAIAQRARAAYEEAPPIRRYP